MHGRRHINSNNSPLITLKQVFLPLNVPIQNPFKQNSPKYFEAWTEFPWTNFPKGLKSHLNNKPFNCRELAPVRPEIEQSPLAMIKDEWSLSR